MLKIDKVNYGYLNQFLTNFLNNKPYRFSVIFFEVSNKLNKWTINLLCHICTITYLIFLSKSNNLSWKYLLAYMLIFPFVFRFIIVTRISRLSFNELSFIKDTSQNNRFNIVLNLKLAESKHIKRAVFKVIIIVLFLYKLTLLYNYGLLYILIYSVFSYITLLKNESYLARTASNSFKYLKNNNLSDLEKEKYKNNAGIYIDNLVVRFKENIESNFYKPQRLSFLLLSSYKNELQVLLYISSYLLLLFLPIENLIYRLITVLSILFGINFILLIYSEMNRLYIVNYFNSTLLWHTSEARTNLIRQCIFPIFSFIGRFNVLTNESLKKSFMEEAKDVAFFSNMPSHFGGILTFILISPFIFLHNFFLGPYKFFQNRFLKNNLIVSNDLNWKTVVENRIKKTDFIIISVEEITKNIQWEIDLVMKHLVPHRVLLLKTKGSEILNFNLLNTQQKKFIEECNLIEYKEDYFSRLVLRHKIIKKLKLLK